MVLFTGLIQMTQLHKNTILEADKRPTSTTVTDLQNTNDTKMGGFISKINLNREYVAQKNYI